MLDRSILFGVRAFPIIQRHVRFRPGDMLRLVALILLLSFASPAAAQTADDAGRSATGTEGTEAYRLAPGDEVEIFVADVPELAYRTMVGSGGNLLLPLGEPVGAAGLTLSELRAAVRSAMADQVIQRQFETGLVPVTIAPDRISVQIAEYRPVYLMGDVVTPGEQSFRPGMTVRQALARGGGYDALRLSRQTLEVAALVSQVDNLRVSLAREEIRNRNLRELIDLAVASAPASRPLGGAPEAAAAFRQIEDEWVAERSAHDARRLNHLTSMTELIEVQRGRLTEQREIASEAVEQDRQELERMQDLATRGLSSAPLLNDARRNLKSSVENFLNTTLALGDLERDARTLTQQIDDLEAESRTRYLQELGDSEQRLRQIRSDLTNTMQTLGMSGKSPDDPDADRQVQAKVQIARIVDDVEERFTAAQDTLVHPGDVIEIRVLTDFGGL